MEKYFKNIRILKNQKKSLIEKLYNIVKLKYKID